MCRYWTFFPLLACCSLGLCCCGGGGGGSDSQGKKPSLKGKNIRLTDTVTRISYQLLFESTKRVSVVNMSARESYDETYTYSEQGLTATLNISSSSNSAYCKMENVVLNFSSEAKDAGTITSGTCREKADRNLPPEFYDVPRSMDNWTFTCQNAGN